MIITKAEKDQLALLADSTHSLEVVRNPWRVGAAKTWTLPDTPANEWALAEVADWLARHDPATCGDDECRKRSAA